MERNPTLGWLDAAAVTAAGALWTDHTWRTGEALLATGRGWWMAPALALGWLAADFATGVVHWFGDRFFREDTPVIGAALIRPFREHHRDPLDMTRHGWLELHGNSCLPVAAVLLALRALPGEPGSAGPRLAFDAWLICFLAAALASNQFHYWAHHPRPPGTVRRLQRWGLILSPRRHGRHHRGGFDRSFCITAGWLNPALDRVDFFGVLERAIRRLPGPRSEPPLE